VWVISDLELGVLRAMFEGKTDWDIGSRHYSPKSLLTVALDGCSANSARGTRHTRSPLGFRHGLLS
jgi:hypothetical protein